MKARLIAIAVAAALLPLQAAFSQDQPGYVTSPYGTNVRNPYGLCWHTGFWTPSMADADCDPSYVSRPVAAATEPVKAPEPAQPEPAPAPVVRPEPAPIVAAPVPASEPRTVIKRVTLEVDVLFPFDKAELLEGGKRRLDEVTEFLKGAEVNEIFAVGYADRIGPASYNRTLSEQRAAAVKEYLTQKGISGEKIATEGRGSWQPVTDYECRDLRGAKLIDCLQPDRRVEIDVYGSREVAVGEVDPSAGVGATGEGSESAR